MRLVCSVPVIVALAAACTSDEPPAEAPARVQPDPLESGGEQRRAFDHRGCSGNPALDAFRELETRIDEVAGTSQWIRR